MVAIHVCADCSRFIMWAEVPNDDHRQHRLATTRPIDGPCSPQCAGAPGPQPKTLRDYGFVERVVPDESTFLLERVLALERDRNGRLKTT